MADGRQRLRDVVTVAVMSSEGMSGADLDAFVTRLPENEQRRATAMRLDARRCSFVLGRMLLRAAVARVGGVRPDEVAVEIEPGGRPVLAGSLKPLSVSIAHSGCYVVVAVASRPVGVDVEQLRHLTSFPRVAARVCSTLEMDRITRLRGASGERAFFAVWARKEAYGKALGRGVDFPMRSVTIARGRISGVAGRWRVRDLDVDPGYATAVAAHGRSWRVRLERIDRTSL
jgi:4'-phosphopantetheinyl transferase